MGCSTYLKELIHAYHPDRALLRLQAYLWFLEFLKLEGDAEPAVIRLLASHLDVRDKYRQFP